MRSLAPILMAFSAMLLSACGSRPEQPATVATAGCGQIGEPGDQTRLTMIRKLLDGGRPYAALAHLEASGMRGPAADLLRADIQRRVGLTAEARSLYQGLLASACFAGSGHHGLGLLAGQDGQLRESIDHLRQARRLLPADARVRSDLGYVLMLAGELESARLEFLTAQDLDPEDRKAAFNLLLLLYRLDDVTGAEVLARRYRIDEVELVRLRSEAARLLTEQGDRQ